MCKFASAVSVEDTQLKTVLRYEECVVENSKNSLFKYLKKKKEVGDDVWNSCHSMELTYG